MERGRSGIAQYCSVELKERRGQCTGIMDVRVEVEVERVGSV